VTAFTMDFGLFDDLDRQLLARDLAEAARSAPVLAGLAAAAAAVAGGDGPLVWECTAAERPGVGAALVAAYEGARADGSAARGPLLRLVATWDTYAGRMS
jgi:hypothetical protein